MSNFNGDSYVDFRNINLRGGATGTGLIRWNPAQFQNSGTNWASNPFGTTDYGLYINSSNQLVYSALGTPTVLGTPGGGGSIPSWNAIWSGSQTLQLAGVSTFTIDNNTGNNNVLTLTNTGNGSGVLLQITNTGSGADISGTSNTWSFSNAGAATMLTATLAGSAGATSLALTLGNIVVSAGGLTMTKAANSATLSVTNNTATTASVIVFAGSGTFTGSTTTSFMTVTASGLTTGTAVYIPTLVLTTGKALQMNYAGTTSHTSGVQTQILSSATAMTSTGRLFQVSHTGVSSASGAGILSEFTSAATDATDILKVTASSTLTGTLFWIAMGSSVTGLGLSIPNVDSITTGFGASIVGSTTALTSTGRLFLVSHTGASTSTGTVAEFITSATDSTVLLKLTSAASVSGVNLSIVGTTGMTTGSLIRATSSTAGAVATNGIYSFLLTGAFTSGASTVGAFHVAGASTVAGTIMSILGGAQTTGIALNITDPSTGMTSGSLLRVITATTGAVATNGIVSFQSSGAFTSTTIGFVNVIVSGAVAGTGVAIQMSATSQTTGIGFRIDQTNTTTGYSGALAQFTGSHTTGGTTLSVVDVTTTTGDGVLISSNALVAGTSTAMRIAHTTSVLGAGNSLLRLSSTSVDTGTTTGTLLDLASTATTGTVSLVTASALTSGIGLSIVSSGASQTTATALSITQSGTATGFTGSLVSILGSSTTGAGNALQVTGVNTTAGDVVKIISNAVTLGAATLLNLSHTTSVLGAGSSMLRITSTGTDTGTTTGTLLDLASTAAQAATLMLMTSASLTTGIGTSLVLAGLTTGVGLKITATAATLTTGFYLACNDGGLNVFTIGSNGHLTSNQTSIPTIGTNSTGISAVALTAGATDTCGQFTTTGTPQSGTVLTLTFNKTYTVAPKTVIISPLNASAGNPNTVPYISSITATTFVMTWPAAGTYAATPSYSYMVVA